MMKRMFWGLLLLLSVPASAQIEARLDSMMRDPLTETTQLGLMVWDLTDDRPVFSCGHRQLLRPASTMKLLTAITALDQLGEGYQFSTAVFYTGDIVEGTLLGDLYCVGGMDPMFDYSDMDSLVNAIKQLGVKRVAGRVVADVSLKDGQQLGEGWCWDDDNPTLTPLLVGRSPEFMPVFIGKLKRAGINMDDATIASGRVPSDGTLVALRGHSLFEVLREMMKESDNLFAESMFYNLAASSGHRPARAIDATRLERAILDRCDLNSARYRIADGSGLSLYNYVTAELEVAILRYAYRRVDIYDKLLPSLPIAGRDGTLKKRMKGTRAENNVQAKTGTLTGVISLAGYLTAANGHRMCFAILNQGVLKASDARDFQDKICKILCEN